jgi:hypothetical protein
MVARLLLLGRGGAAGYNLLLSGDTASDKCARFIFATSIDYINDTF